MRTLFLIFSFMLIGTTAAFASSQQYAELNMEIERLAVQVKQLKTDMETCYDGYEKLLKQMETLNLKVGNDLQNQATEIQGLRNLIASSDDEVSKQIDAKLDKLGTRAEEVLKSLAHQSLTVTTQSAPANIPEPDFGEGILYEVQSGDTLGAVASKYKTSVKLIMSANRIGDPKHLRAGQTIFIPNSE